MKVGEYFDFKIGVPISRYQDINGREREVISTKGISDLGIERKNSERICLSNIDSDFLTREDDILVKLTPPFQMNLVKDEVGLVVTHSLGILRLNEKYKGKVNVEYVSHYLNGNLVKKQLTSLSEGSGVIILKRNNLLDIELALPSIEIQEKYGRFWTLLNRKQKLLDEKARKFDIIRKNLIGNITIGG